MMKQFLAIAVMALSSFCSLSAQTATSTYTPGATTEGIVYFLPKTAIRVAVQIEKTTYTPGDFAQYAERFLRLKDVSSEPSTVHRIISLSQTAVGERDTTKAFVIKFNNKTSAVNVSRTDDGLLLAVNAQPLEQNVPTPFKAHAKRQPLDPRQFMSEEILAAGSKAKMAQLTAQEIYDIRDSRSQLIKGQADFMPKDAEQMKMMLSQLEQQDQALTSLFTGTVVRDTVEEIFMVHPSAELAKVPLFRFSRHFGVVDIDDMSGAPYFITVQNLTELPATDEKKAAKRKKEEDGLYYNVPGKMRTTVFRGNEPLNTEDLPSAQFGNVELLSGELFNKHYGTRLWMNAITGGIDRLEAEQSK
jgi:hypothetical protein